METIYRAHRRKDPSKKERSNRVLSIHGVPRIKKHTNKLPTGCSCIKGMERYGPGAFILSSLS